MWVRSYKELSRIYVALFYRHLSLLTERNTPELTGAQASSLA